MVAPVKHIDWSYTKDIDVHQLWAQADALFSSGEPWNLSAVEGKTAEEMSQAFEVADYLEARIDRYFDIEPNNGNYFTTTDEMIDVLEKGGTRESALSLARRIATVMKQRDVSEGRRTIGGKKYRGWVGVRRSLYTP
jgi:predicted P-loop ATPase